MPEEATVKKKYRYEKAAKKGWLYHNADKREGDNKPDYRGKVVEVEVEKIKAAADDEGFATLSVSGWIEEDQKGENRIGLSVQTMTPEGDGDSPAPF